ncbi:hypothetical protein [Larkinella harenae]
MKIPFQIRSATPEEAEMLIRLVIQTTPEAFGLSHNPAEWAEAYIASVF